MADSINSCYEVLLDIKGIFPNWCNTQNNFYYHWKRILSSSIDGNEDIINFYTLALEPLINSRDGIESNSALELIRKLDDYRKSHDEEFQTYNLEQLLNKDTSSIKVPQKQVKVTRPKPTPKKIIVEEVSAGNHTYGTRNKSKSSSEEDRSPTIGKHFNKGFFSDYVWDFMIAGEQNNAEE